MNNDYRAPTLENGWFIFGSNVKYVNTPLVKADKVTSLSYHIDRKGCIFFIMFGTVNKEERWEFSEESQLKEDYNALLGLLKEPKEEL